MKTLVDRRVEEEETYLVVEREEKWIADPIDLYDNEDKYPLACGVYVQTGVGRAGGSFLGHSRMYSIRSYSIPETDCDDVGLSSNEYRGIRGHSTLHRSKYARKD